MRRQDQIGASNPNGSDRHTVVFGRLWFLRNGDAAGRLDCLDASGTVGSRTRKNDADGPVFLIVCKTDKEPIHRRFGTDGIGGLADHEFATNKRNVGVGRRNVDDVCHRLHVVFCLSDIERSFSPQEFHHKTAMVRRHVLRQYVGHVCVLRQVRNKRSQRLQPTG